MPRVLQLCLASLFGISISHAIKFRAWLLNSKQASQLATVHQRVSRMHSMPLQRRHVATEMPKANRAAERAGTGVGDVAKDEVAQGFLKLIV